MSSSCERDQHLAAADLQDRAGLSRTDDANSHVVDLAGGGPDGPGSFLAMLSPSSDCRISRASANLTPMVQPSAAEAPPKKSNLFIILLVALAGICVVLPMIAALGIYGLRRYLIAAKQTEARQGLAALARGVVSCAAAPRSGVPAGLPPTARPVPQGMESIRGMKYMSAPSDWEDEAYKCAGFALGTPQYAQYQWIRLSATRGVARAIGDLNGDSVPDFTFEQEVDCASGTTCTLGAVKEE
jgi:hypothetical protein